MKTCCICGKKFDGWGNNPEPVKSDGECCDYCNWNVVIPARFGYLKGKSLEAKVVEVRKITKE